MKTTTMKKSVVSSVAGLFAFALLLSPFFSAQAADVKKPKIRSIETVTSSTVTLPFKWHQYDKSVKTKVKVRIENLSNGNITFQTLDSKVNGNGHGKVTVTGLKAGTKYAFKIKVRKITLRDYSAYSSRKAATTMVAATSASTSASSADTGTDSGSSQQ